MSYRHTIAPCSINSAFNLAQLHNVSVQPGANPDIVVPGGSLDPAAVIMSSAQFRISFATHDLATILAQISITAGLKCTSDSTFYWQRRADSAAFLGSSSHQKLVSTDGFLMLNGISATQGQRVESTFSFYPHSSDGQTQPVTYSDAVSLGTSPAFSSAFYFYGAKLGSSFLNGVTGTSYDSGMTYRYAEEDGCVYPKRGHIEGRTPTISLTTHYVKELLDTITPHMGNDGFSNLKIFFQKGSSGGARVALATAEHIAITFATGAWTIGSIDGQGSGDVTNQIRATCIDTPTLTVGTAIS